LLLVSIGGVASPPATAQDSAPARPGVYRRPLGNEPGTLDPPRIGDVYGRSIAQQVFDGLVEYDNTLTITPALAQYWKASRDGLTWTFTLRKGARFHNGRAVTADDVVYSLTRLLDPRLKSPAADLFANISGAREFREGKAPAVRGLVALDATTLRVMLEEPQAPFVYLLAIGHAKVVPREVATRAGDAFGSAPVGSGPFRFERWERGKEIVLAANRDYWGGQPRLDRIVYRIFPSETFVAMYQEFLKGNLEDTPVPMQDYPKLLASTPGIHVKRPMISVRFLGLNTRVKPLDDARVRRALVHAIDRDAIVQDATRGRFVVARGILPPGTLGYNPGLHGYGYDPARARDLLTQAGYPAGRGLPPLAIYAGAKLDREHQMVTRYLEAVGVQVEFKYVTDWPQFSRMLGEGKFPMFQLAWFADVPDPDDFLFKLFHSKSPRNNTGYVNPQFDRLVERARTEPDGQRRAELYRRAEQMVMDDAVVVPFFHYTYERVFQPYVRSVEVSGLGDPYIPFRKIWLEPR
jgi:oligopeptide transport system substrate-binding protein